MVTIIGAFYEQLPSLLSHTCSYVLWCLMYLTSSRASQDSYFTCFLPHVPIALCAVVPHLSCTISAFMPLIPYFRYNLPNMFSCVSCLLALESSPSYVFLAICVCFQPGLHWLFLYLLSLWGQLPYLYFIILIYQTCLHNEAKTQFLWAMTIHQVY